MHCRQNKASPQICPCPEKPQSPKKCYFKWLKKITDVINDTDSLDLGNSTQGRGVCDENGLGARTEAPHPKFVSREAGSCHLSSKLYPLNVSDPSCSSLALQEKSLCFLD